MSAPGIVRLAAGAWLRTVAWSAEASLDAARSLLGAEQPAADPPPPPPPSPPTLRERGAALLSRSADLDEEEAAHPAYAQILGQLAPDEARILRLFVERGPQPAIDVRTVGLVFVGSELVGAGFNMIGAEAGCRHTDRVHAYLNNLFRLGLVWFSREQVSDSMRYQVLEAQPEVLAAMREGGRTKTVRRSIHLTDFGRDFCDTCLPVTTAELDALPRDP
jgi:hypothetical protein